ncbi:MAG: penicillin-binding protein 1A [Xanthomonadaceae bacterium]|nr:penicillin-binding protein 1A [Xanthomonadaceae bacterium]
MKLRYLVYTLAALFLAALLAGAVGTGVAVAILVPKLPSVEVLRDVRFQVPLRVYTADGGLIAEFGEKRRIPLQYQEIPELMVKAFIAAEDDRFFKHPGVDYQGLLRAFWNLVLTGERTQGGSTITMQVARNFFLSSEKTYLRKANEILLALKIERELSKEQILELYLNKIYLGNRAYGVGAAAQVYYGRPVSELDLAEIAMIAGLPKAPSAYNPVANPERAMLRRAYVLRRMRELGFISDQEYAEASAMPNTARAFRVQLDAEAHYAAEMARTEMVERYGEAAYTDGYRVYTTLDRRAQQAAVAAVRKALLDYDRRHGYRGPVAQVPREQLQSEQQLQQALSAHPRYGDLRPAVVTALDDAAATVVVQGLSEPQELPFEGMKWARPFINRDVVGDPPKRPGDVVQPGDVIYVQPWDDGWQLVQLPEVEGALVALSPLDGAIRALVGGFDFFRSKFNRATQAQRQPGSAFKPFVYSAALEKGFTPATIVNDAPVVFRDEALEGTWRPENYSGRFYGPTRLRVGLTQSRNLVSIRVLRDIGVAYAVDYITRFGFDRERLAPNLSLSLGNASVTPLELAAGYAVFANGGYRVTPYLIARVEDADGNVIYEANPPRVCPECEQATEASPLQPVAASALAPEVNPAPRVISAQNAYLMTSMLQDVVQYGTGRRLLELGRSDLAGKTGTTNDQRDGWFGGFTPHLAVAAWVGFDQSHPMGAGETGARNALPMWLEFMRVALDGVPEQPMPLPEGLVTVRIDPETGLMARADNPSASFEVFRADEVPPLEPARSSGGQVPERSLF